MSAVPESVQRWLDFLTVDPEAQNIQSAVAVSLAKLRENGTVSRRDAKSLMLLAQSLNPRSMPAVVTEWMDHVRARRRPLALEPKRSCLQRASYQRQ